MAIQTCTECGCPSIQKGKELNFYIYECLKCKKQFKVKPLSKRIRREEKGIMISYNYQQVFVREDAKITWAKKERCLTIEQGLDVVKITNEDAYKAWNDLEAKGFKIILDGKM